ncbi:MAG: alpha/beta hydrolase [Candidatus Accumulibacter sp.]|jgi:pimeloyl-ACP methyl ester carboxylesterase|nr:alpha/beta hydrolase [Accumulibacter sp.]
MNIPRKWLVPQKREGISVWRWLLERLLIAFGIALSVLLVSVFLFKERFMFHPSPEMAITPKDLKLLHEEKWLETPDGLKMKAWRIGLPKNAGKPVILVFHGNGGNMSHFSQWEVLASLGLTVMTIDYPGYGESEGKPSEERTYQAAEALWQWAAAPGTPPETIVFYGFSLGGAVAAQLAVRHPPAALILDSTFTRLRDVPSARLPVLAPLLRLILGDAFDTQSRLALIRCPLLLIHSRDDDVIPFRLGEKLFAAYSNHRKIFVTGQGGHHDFLLNEALYLRKIQDFLSGIPAPASKKP